MSQGKVGGGWRGPAFVVGVIALIVAAASGNPSIGGFGAICLIAAVLGD